MVNKRIKITLVNKTCKEIDLSNIARIEEDMFSGHTDMLKVALPEGVLQIGRNAFEGCTSLVEVLLPKSVQQIDYEAFANCVSLKKINIPEGAQVDSTAFHNCRQLKVS